MKKYKVLVADDKKKLYNRAMNNLKNVNNDLIRINKYLSSAGVCSRREADRLLEAGRVTVDGKILQKGECINSNAVVFVDGKPVSPESKKIILIFNKPRGIVCSTKKQRQEITVTEYIDYPVRVYPVGRLDKESEGLLILTNQGDLVNRIMRAGNYHEKEYQVTVDKDITDYFLDNMRCGVPILDTITRRCKVTQTGVRSFNIVLTQGLNRQIRRMCEYLGYHVCSLKRVRIMNITLGTLKCGEYREIEMDEEKKLYKLLEHSSSLSLSGSGGENVCKGRKRNERAGSKAQQGGKSLLSGRSGDNK